MKSTAVLISTLTAAVMAAAAGCYTPTPFDENATAAPPKTPAPDAATIAPSNTDPSGLPCEIADFLTNHCIDCHGVHPDDGVPNQLLTYANLAAPSASDPSKSNAALAVERMRSTKRPMPPDAPLDADQIAVFANWVSAGMSKGTCAVQAPDGGTDDSDSGDSSDAGADTALEASPDERGADAASDASTVCTSGTFWADQSPASALMNPGEACIACHSKTGGPPYVLAGTVYPTLHEPDDCNGATNVSVLIIDATGTTHTIPVNAAGNFTRVTTLPMPYRAMIVRGSSVSQMNTPQTDGDCNGCHSGSSALGRVLAP
jgi:hypothetical protein